MGAGGAITADAYAGSAGADGDMTVEVNAGAVGAACEVIGADVYVGWAGTPAEGLITVEVRAGSGRAGADAPGVMTVEVNAGAGVAA